MFERVRFFLLGAVRRARSASAQRGTYHLLSSLALLLALTSASPALAAPPTITRFNATFSDTNKVTLDWQVSGGESSGWLYIYDVGYQAQSCSANGCSKSFRVTRGATYSYTLAVQNDAKQWAYSTRTVVVPDLPRPSTPASHVDVDMVQPTNQTLTWTRNGSGKVTVSYTDHRLGDVDHGRSIANLPATGSYTIPAADLATPGRMTVDIKYCETPAANEPSICASGTSVDYVIGPPRFTSPYRKFAPTTQDLTVTWTKQGTSWYVSSDSLPIGAWVTNGTPSLTIPKASLKTGLHRLTVTSCHLELPGSPCSNRGDTFAPVSGTIVSYTGVKNYFGIWFAGDEVAVLQPDNGSAPVSLLATKTGKFTSEIAVNGHVDASKRVGFIISQDVGTTELVIGSSPSVVAWEYRPWQTFFSAATGRSTALERTGAPLDIAFNSLGDAWQIGEYSAAAVQSHAGVLSSHDEPLLQTLDANLVYQRATPYWYVYSLTQAGPISVSIDGERILDTGKAIWYTQGGTPSGHDAPGPNHSRLVRFDYNKAHDPSTLQDERQCVVHMPGNNNNLAGAAYDPATKHLWFTEQTSGKVGWLLDDPTAIHCDNALDYSKQSAVDAASTNNTCDGTSKWCVHYIPGTYGQLTHITVDQLGPNQSAKYVWFTDYNGGALNAYPATGGDNGTVLQFKYPPQSGTSLLSGDSPWQIRADANAVYVIEYGESQLVRFEKRAGWSTGACNASPNPCMSELFLPLAGSDANGHSLALSGNNLWFTIANEHAGPDDNAASLFGYVDVSTWTATSAPKGVIYNNLSSLGNARPNDHHCFRGIDVTAGGKVALADGCQEELDVLTPR